MCVKYYKQMININFSLNCVKNNIKTIVDKIFYCLLLKTFETKLLSNASHIKNKCMDSKKRQE